MGKIAINLDLKWMKEREKSTRHKPPDSGLFQWGNKEFQSEVGGRGMQGALEISVIFFFLR